MNKNLFYSRVTGIVAGLGLVGVGLIQDKPEIFYDISHQLSAIIFFLFMTLSILFCGLYFKNSSNSQWDKRLYYISLFIVCMSALFLLLSFFKHPVDIGITVFSISVVWQKLTVASIFSWFIPFLIFGANLIDEKTEPKIN